MSNQYTASPSAKTPAACAQCGEAIKRWPSQRKPERLYFCSRDCHADWKYAQALAALQEPRATRLPNGCLIFNGTKNTSGHGRLKIGGKRRSAHVVAWEQAHGRPVPEGLIGCHTCPGGDNPACVEPSHVWLGTTADNNADKALKGRSVKGQQRPQAKLTDDIVREIRARYVTGEISQESLAYEYGVSQVLIGLVVRRKIWRHIEG